MDWLWWLLAPLAVTTAASVWTWWANRLPRPLSYEQSLIAHRRFLADLDRWTPPSVPAHASTQGAPPDATPPPAPTDASPSRRRPPAERGDRASAA